ncbi:MAG TPA: 2Fe-2S iron-sulfur cluster-binding protein [Geminicoccus sp.]|uniref:2Fe-2S iron-sulfur cluster-binding protein n=1 Tax=Geminicoccus sp. TaxID=2024832 RepID=UPI002C01BB18|nr:2Fe-2S iron-sulfur cluster-binding protein [Geminicoccus sp.]HWL72167.1 2Fe-2S iron-sulfur cluster-binding protein [Geminicoccus sp.]
MSHHSLRLPAGGTDLDRARPLSFTFAGRRLQGFAGDSLASALLASGQRVLARSFKYHRPRGLWGFGPEEPNTILDVRFPDGRHDPNARATLVPLEDGMVVGTVHGWPSAQRDLYGFVDRLHPLIPAGFYYKTFMRPSWHLFEPRIRKMAGLGVVPDQSEPLQRAQRHAQVPLVVVGAGPAGLAAARAAALAGLEVMLVDDQPRPGGQLLTDPVVIDGQPGDAWVAVVTAELVAHPKVTLLPTTTALGIFDHGLLVLAERRRLPRGFAPERLWKVRAGQVILATGAIERPLVFPDNDRPGVMSAFAARSYLARHGVLAGRHPVVLTGNAAGRRTAELLAAAGAEPVIVDLRADSPPHPEFPTYAGAVVTAVHGRKGVTGVRVEPLSGGSATEIACDLVAVAGGWTPSLHLHMHAGGRLRFEETIDAFVPEGPAGVVRTVGAANGAFATADCLVQGHQAGLLAASADLALPAPVAEPEPAWTQAVWRKLDRPKARQWVDYQHDVTAKDIELAVQENFVSVEHLKRYTTLGMATDQGKTSNLNGLGLLAQRLDRPVAEVGTTTFRPPYTPFSLAGVAGSRQGSLLSPLRLLPAYREHQRQGAVFEDYGGWWRPACYPKGGEGRQAAIEREVLATRSGVALFDGSPLGKIELKGRDAGSFLDRLYYHRLSDLKPGRIRYVFLLTEHGKVYDDGVVARLAEDHFLLSPSSSHAAGVHAIVEEWRQTGWPELEVIATNVTTAWATYAVTGPKARRVVERLPLPVDLSAAALPHMGFCQTELAGVPLRIARVSFTGELSFELSVPAAYGPALYRRLEELGAPEGMVPLGSEALLVLRAEKGYVLVGRDTDGNTEPQDLGFTAPLRTKQHDFVGRRSLQRVASREAGRLELVGLRNTVPDEPIPTGAHMFIRDEAGNRKSRGYVTSAYRSPTLGRPIALAILADGRALQEQGAEVDLFHLDRTYRARVVSPVFYDPAGERLRG